MWTAPRAVFERIDASFTQWLARHGVQFLRISLGIVFLWFGALKFVPGMSPAEELAARTIGMLTFGHVTANVALYLLAAWECAIGLGLLLKVWMRITLFLLFVQMLGTATPLALFPNESFLHFPFAPTLEGQYIIKNLVLLSAGMVIGATVRGGALVADPNLARRDPAHART
ncbi:MAG: DoxX family membrane protein [Planctomycetes bacterium]|nr:DoxX family membrane protein [Planctomycetota bacterium]